MDSSAVVLVIGIFSIVTDLVILVVVPIPLMCQLKITTQKKWMLLFTFALGCSACVVSITRLAVTICRRFRG